MNQSGVHPNSRAAVSQSNRERAAAARRERELRARTPHPTPHLDAARDEFGSTRPALAVESLDEKLEKAISGAITRWSCLRPSHEGWQVRLDERVLATGATEAFTRKLVGHRARRARQRRAHVRAVGAVRPGRDTNAPCDMFSPGKPTNGGCQGDGHYLCRECGLFDDRGEG